MKHNATRPCPELGRKVEGTSITREGAVWRGGGVVSCKTRCMWMGQKYLGRENVRRRVEGHKSSRASEEGKYQTNSADGGLTLGGCSWGIKRGTGVKRKSPTGDRQGGHVERWS